MAVMNRSMFQRPMPVVRRMAGTPKTGEQNYEDQGYDAYEYRADQEKNYEDQGYDAYEYRADQAMDTQNNKPSFLGNIFNDITDFFKFGRSDPESRLIIAGEYFDPEDPSFKMFIENNYMSDGDTYIEAIEKFKAFAESQKRSEGSPIQGEKSDRFGEKRINELMEFASGAGDLSKQFDRDEGVAQFTMEDYVRLEGPNYTPEAELKLIQSFGTQDEIETMITIVKRMQDPSERDEQQYEEDSKIRRALVNKYFDRIGGIGS